MSHHYFATENYFKFNEFEILRNIWGYRFFFVSIDSAYENVMANCRSELKEVKGYLRHLRFS